MADTNSDQRGRFSDPAQQDADRQRDERLPGNDPAVETDPNAEGASPAEDVDGLRKVEGLRREVENGPGLDDPPRSRGQKISERQRDVPATLEHGQKHGDRETL